MKSKLSNQLLLKVAEQLNSQASAESLRLVKLYKITFFTTNSNTGKDLNQGIINHIFNAASASHRIETARLKPYFYFHLVLKQRVLQFVTDSQHHRTYREVLAPFHGDNRPARRRVMTLHVVLGCLKELLLDKNLYCKTVNLQVIHLDTFLF